MKKMNVQMKRVAFILVAGLFATMLMAQGRLEKAYQKAFAKAKAAGVESTTSTTSTSVASTKTQSGDSRHLKPGDAWTMKMYKKALKSKDVLFRLSTYRTLAEDGYAPAQYKLYRVGEGDEWLEKAALGGHLEAMKELLDKNMAQWDEFIVCGRNCIVQLRGGGTVNAKEMPSYKEREMLYQQTMDKLAAMKASLATLTPEDENYFPPMGSKKGAEERMRSYIKDWPELLDVYSAHITRSRDECTRLEKEINSLSQKK